MATIRRRYFPACSRTTFHQASRGLWAILFIVTLGFPANSIVEAQEIDFPTQIRPILNRHCVACHGPDEGHRAADLRLDNFDDATDWAIVPGEPESSEVVARIMAEDDDYRMPPADHSLMTAAEKELLQTWIANGAEYSQHWSFKKPGKVEIPPTDLAVQGGSPIDFFIDKKLAQLELQPNPVADPHRLVRRLALDLSGLPPSEDQIARFVNNHDLATYESIVDELLASPTYGEHWAAMWLDLARYADSMGYTEDLRRTIWPWRDWLIRALNRNLPYDQFTRELIAGDLLPNASVDQRLGTAFHRNTLTNTEGGTIDEEFRVIAVKDRVNTTVNVWMGLTIGCAECHTHKYDPISIEDYYRFYDFFNQTADADFGDEEPRLSIPSPTITIVADLAGAIKAAVANVAAMTKVPVIQELPPDARRKTKVMIRGSYLAPGEVVTAAVPEAFHPFPEQAPANRLGVSQWLTDRENPLTARVAVNRYWARLFGRGIVFTEEDFGLQGALPTHPEMLDWLAVDFQDNGWDSKRLLKQMVMSSTYRRSSTASETQLASDPDNLFLARMSRPRLPAEVVRDQALQVSGLLSPKMYGPPVFPPSPIKEIQNAFAGVFHWKVSEGEDRYRRALYTFLKRSQPHPLFDTFDMSSRQVCSLRRVSTNTPLQAFMTLNDEAFIECAQQLARKMLDHSAEPQSQIEFGLQAALKRPAKPMQTQILLKLYQDSLADFTTDPQRARELTNQTDDAPGRSPAPGRLPAPEEQVVRWGAMTVVANVILNLDEFLTK